MKVNFVTNEKIAETSSKGNQEKWKDGNIWYKLDQFGYEALAETLISSLLEKSNIEKDSPFTFTRYKMEKMNVHNRERTGCSSENFLFPNQSIITLSHLFNKLEKTPLRGTLSKLSSDKKRIQYIAESTADITGLKDFPKYLTLLFEVDALFLNDDRHLNNIAVLEKNGKYDYCPIFDNGAALLSNVRVNPMDISPKALVSLQIAKPFNTTFNRQIITAHSLYGHQLKIPKFTSEEIKEELENLLPYYPERDRALISDRVCTTILTRQKFFK